MVIDRYMCMNVVSAKIIDKGSRKIFLFHFVFYIKPVVVCLILYRNTYIFESPFGAT